MGSATSTIEVLEYTDNPSIVYIAGQHIVSRDVKTKCITKTVPFKRYSNNNKNFKCNPSRIEDDKIYRAIVQWDKKGSMIRRVGNGYMALTRIGKMKKGVLIVYLNRQLKIIKEERCWNVSHDVLFRKYAENIDKLREYTNLELLSIGPECKELLLDREDLTKMYEDYDFKPTYNFEYDDYDYNSGTITLSDRRQILKARIYLDGTYRCCCYDSYSNSIVFLMEMYRQEEHNANEIIIIYCYELRQFTEINNIWVFRARHRWRVYGPLSVEASVGKIICGKQYYVVNMTLTRFWKDNIATRFNRIYVINKTTGKRYDFHGAHPIIRDGYHLWIEKYIDFLSKIDILKTLSESLLALILSYVG